MTKGASKRNAERRERGEPRRLPGSGRSVDDVTTIPWDQVPKRIRSAIPQQLLAQLWHEAREIALTELSLEERRVALISEFRDQGLSWDSCGWFVGVTGEAVRQRYGQVLDDAMSSDLGDGWGEDE